MSSRSAIALLLLAACATEGCDRKSPARGQATPAPADAASPDEVAAPATPAAAPGTIDRSHKGEAGLAAAFETPEGKPVTLAAFRGKPVLLNLWATWCAPCIQEMPSLDAAAGAAGDRLVVLAVSQDLDPAKVASFFASAGLARLKPYRDPKLALSIGYQANLPMTILFDSRGAEVWRTTGSMDWTSAPARALIAEAS